jgi:hypothetical protein
MAGCCAKAAKTRTKAHEEDFDLPASASTRFSAKKWLPEALEAKICD